MRPGGPDVFRSGNATRPSFSISTRSGTSPIPAATEGERQGIKPERRNEVTAPGQGNGAVCKWVDAAGRNHGRPPTIPVRDATRLPPVALQSIPGRNPVRPARMVSGIRAPSENAPSWDSAVQTSAPRPCGTVPSCPRRTRVSRRSSSASGPCFPGSFRNRSP